MIPQITYTGYRNTYQNEVVPITPSENAIVNARKPQNRRIINIGIMLFTFLFHTLFSLCTTVIRLISNFVNSKAPLYRTSGYPEKFPASCGGDRSNRLR